MRRHIASSAAKALATSCENSHSVAISSEISAPKPTTSSRPVPPNDDSRRGDRNLPKLPPAPNGVESPAHGPGSHSMFSALRPWIAAQVFSAITATPAEMLAEISAPGCEAPMGATMSTPRIFLAALSSKDLRRPSKYGQRAITAYTMPGMRASIP